MLGILSASAGAWEKKPGGGGGCDRGCSSPCFRGFSSCLFFVFFRDRGRMRGRMAEKAGAEYLLAISPSGGVGLRYYWVGMGIQELRRSLFTLSNTLLRASSITIQSAVIKCDAAEPS